MDKWSSGQRTGAVVCVGFTSANIKGKEGLKGREVGWELWEPLYSLLSGLGVET